MWAKAYKEKQKKYLFYYIYLNLNVFKHTGDQWRINNKNLGDYIPHMNKDWQEIYWNTEL